MLKKAELGLAYSCLNRAADNEPIFVLRANDELAPDIVRQWAKAYQLQKTGMGQHEIGEPQRAKYFDALNIAEQMETWRNQLVFDKLPSPNNQADLERTRKLHNTIRAALEEFARTSTTPGEMAAVLEDNVRETVERLRGR